MTLTINTLKALAATNIFSLEVIRIPGQPAEIYMVGDGDYPQEARVIVDEKGVVTEIRYNGKNILESL